MSWKEMEEEDDQEALNKAIMQSLQSSSSQPTIAEPEEEDELKRAISLSLSGGGDVAVASTSSTTTPEQQSIEFIRQRRLLRLGQTTTPKWVDSFVFLSFASSFFRIVSKKLCFFLVSYCCFLTAQYVVTAVLCKKTRAAQYTRNCVFN